jgi:hypothetical protein
MTKKKRTDSHQFLTETLQAAGQTILPPTICQLPDKALPFWHAIIATKHPTLWTPNDLIQAANLARITLEIEQLWQSGQPRIDDGRPSAFHRVMTDLQGEQMSLARSLQIHSRATNGEAGKLAGRNRAFHEARRITEIENDPDSLIAMPNRKQ